jgi:hypothetical protein
VITLAYVPAQPAAWLASVLGAVRGVHWLGPAVVAVLVVFHLIVPAGRSSARILVLAAVSIPFGFVFDSLLVGGGVYEPVRWLLPAPWATLWLLALWVNFALILDVPLRWLQRHLPVAALCGGIFGPTAYLAAERLGAIDIAAPRPMYIVILAGAWAVGLAALMLAARLLPTFSPRAQTSV